VSAITEVLGGAVGRLARTSQLPDSVITTGAGPRI
jgi:hypothetical protein